MATVLNTTRISHCPNCNGARNCTIVGTTTLTKELLDKQYYYDWYLLTCCGCNEVFVERVDYNSVHGELITNLDGEEEFIHDESIAYFPTFESFKKPEWMKHFLYGSLYEDRFENLKHMILEVYSAINNDCFALGCVGIRSCFDISCQLLDCDTKLTFANKLAFLRDNHIISESDKNNLEILIEAGNAATHRMWIPNYNDVELLIGELQRFLFDSFVKKKIDEVGKTNLETLKSTIPPK